MSETIDWSGKGINDIDDMKSKFRTWMKRQKKSDGESYSPKTITAYINALKNSTIKLDLGDEVLSNLFYYIAPDEFEKAHQKILNAPNFDSVDKATENESYSNGMVLYKKFLNELGEPSCWIFQNKPENYDVVGAVKALDTLTLRVKQHREEIKKGDKAYIWQSGPDSGIIASGIIMNDPELTTFQDPYIRGDFLKNDDPYLAVEIKVKRKFIQSRVLRAVLQADERTKQLDIFKQRQQGTNFRVTKAQDEAIESIINGIEEDEIDDEPKTKYYSENDFLNEAYMDAEHYATLKSLLLRKKNIILQGAPGVGKTYIAQRLAFSIMGEKDTSRVKVVQFHQSYSYEDFVMGYRPDGSGFTVKDGPFYKFCEEAKKDDEREYFFIIDEINRGNLSKIFGELLMLIEGDKRGEGNAIRLLYKDELFFVPSNVYIIGMMNTADRSLAMIDYALRRRFAFFEMEPAFSSEGFKSYQKTKQNSKFDALIKIVEDLNKDISEDISLGKGFRIGHSYFCTPDIVNDSWLSDVVEYELLPLLNEYWFDEPAKVDLWSRRLRGVTRG